MPKRILLILLVLWIGIRVHYVVRETFGKGQIRDYAALFSRDLEGKRSYVTGDRLYEFIRFCSDNLPAGSSFRLEGIDKDSIDRVRTLYYLYPNTESAQPEYLLVYDSKDAPSIGYDLVAKLDRERYILRRAS